MMTQIAVNDSVNTEKHKLLEGPEEFPNMKSKKLRIDGNENSQSDEKTSFCFSKHPDLEEIRQMQATFSKERNWDQFHQPRNLLLAMTGEVGEVAEIFQWRGEVQVGLPDWTLEDRTKLCHELSDVLIYLLELADKCRIDLPQAVIRKMSLNAKKYPPKKQEEMLEATEAICDEEFDCDNPEEESGTFHFSSKPTIEDIRQKQEKFCAARNWQGSKLPRNILLAMTGEVGEVAELFQWRGEVPEGLPGWTKEERTALSHELSDVLIYLIELADKCHVDLPSAVEVKMNLNRKKYPVEKVYGSSKKYTEYE